MWHFFASRANTREGLVKSAKVALNARFGSGLEPEFDDIRYMTGRTSKPVCTLCRLGWFDR